MVWFGSTAIIGASEQNGIIERKMALLYDSEAFGHTTLIIQYGKWKFRRSM